MAERTCSVEGCERSHLARGWCGTHYRRWQRTGSTDEPTRPTPRSCAVADCGRPSAKRGWCEAHYYRWRTSGDPGPARFKRVQPPIIAGKKQCSACDEWLPLDAFGPLKTGVGGRRGRCRECLRAATLEWRAQNPGYFLDWQRANPDKVMAVVHARRATRAGREHERIDRSVVFERDGYTCQLCAGPLDMDAPRYDSWSPTIDHIVPLSVGGDHLYSNIQAAHLRCNVVKGNKTRAT